MQGVRCVEELLISNAHGLNAKKIRKPRVHKSPWSELRLITAQFYPKISDDQDGDHNFSD